MEWQTDDYQSARPEHGDSMQSRNAGTIAALPGPVNYRAHRSFVGSAAFLLCASLLAMFCSNVLFIAGASRGQKIPARLKWIVPLNQATTSIDMLTGVGSERSRSRLVI